MAAGDARPGRAAARPPVLVLVVVLLCLGAAGGAAALAGPFEVGPRSVLADAIAGFVAALPDPVEGGGATDPPPGRPAPDRPAVVGQPDLAVLAWVLVALVLAVLVRRLLRRRGLDEHPAAAPADPSHPRAGGAGLGDGLTDTLRRATIQAQTAVHLGPARDGVIACWLALEEACQRVGTTRRPTMTSTEFTAAVLAAHRADPAAVQRLLRTYQRARYGAAAVGPDDVARAVAALEQIRDGLAPAGGTR